MDGQCSNVVLSHLDPIRDDLGERLRVINAVMTSRYAAIDRIAIAVYDKSTDMVSTFASSNSHTENLNQYSARLSDVPSLALLAQNRQSRLIRAIPQALIAESPHSVWLRDQQYQSSYTVPIYESDELVAFMFFDSKQIDGFDEDTTRFLDVFADLISQLYLLHLRVTHGLVGTVHVASGLARLRDIETGGHLDRMAGYARLMASALSRTHKLSDEFIAYVHLFAPLHDVGKVGIPDSILLKPGRLNDEEWGIMRQHVTLGGAIIDEIAANMGLQGTRPSRIMRNIVMEHHERGDGSGYPAGLRMTDISIEARIVAVADVYDALSSKRPYKEAWSEEAIRTELDREVAKGRLDGDCVDVLMRALGERQALQVQFPDE